MTMIELLELLKQWTNEMTTAKNVRQQLKLATPSLETMIELEKAMACYAPPRGRPQPPVQEEAPPEVENKIHQIFEQGIPSAGSKEQFHAENKQGKRCFDDHVAKEQEQGIFHVDQGSSPFTANLPGRCTGCGQVILKGDVIIIRAKERGVA